uniref:Uncharacterized protein n=1 Tax=Nelumbo nucifera TaxID=4432 RepID=A0A822XLR7_NELNU|nr:TPA_asm: hypothetical protein HUJ06_021604 [Nelumbo nucifera]
MFGKESTSDFSDCHIYLIGQTVFLMARVDDSSINPFDVS